MPKALAGSAGGARRRRALYRKIIFLDGTRFFSNSVLPGGMVITATSSIGSGTDKPTIPPSSVPDHNGMLTKRIGKIFCNRPDLFLD
jgi:hypothetical protein